MALFSLHLTVSLPFSLHSLLSISLRLLPFCLRVFFFPSPHHLHLFPSFVNSPLPLCHASFAPSLFSPSVLFFSSCHCRSPAPCQARKRLEMGVSDRVCRMDASPWPLVSCLLCRVTGVKGVTACFAETCFWCCCVTHSILRGDHLHTTYC